jgi:hypothetical protein
MGFVSSLHAQTGDWTDPANRAPGLDMSGGKGDTKGNPILITSEAELAFLASEVRGSAINFAGKYFKLTRNLDLKDHYWKSIGMQHTTSSLSRQFQGNFDGGGFTIYNMIIQPATVQEGGQSKGLFGYITGGASIENVFLEKAVIEGNSSTGGLVGVAVNSTISNCCVLGTIRNVQDFAGGIAASADGCQMTKCYSNMKFENVKSYVGGLAGRLRNSCTLSTCYSAGTVEGLTEVGGLVGLIESGTVVTDSYSMATVIANRDLSGTGGAPTGGIVGAMSQDSEISNCFARNTWIRGVMTSESIVNVNRVVGIATSSTGHTKLQNNVALANMLVSRNAGANFAKIQDEPVDPQNTPNGRGILNGCEWEKGADWVMPDENDCTVPPIVPGQSAPVTRRTNTTKEIVVKHLPPYAEMDKIILQNSKYVDLAVGTQINDLGGNPNEDTRLWKFTPRSPKAFVLGDTLYAVAYEKNKMPSYPVRIIIVSWETNEDGYNEIFRESQLDSVRYFPDEKYILMADLDMATYPEKFEPIGTKDDPFTGEFNGNNHIIDNLVINNPDEDYQGLFGGLEGSVKDLGLENVYITGNNFVGALAGYGNSTKAIIQNVYTTGTIDAKGDNVGGLAGQLAAKVLRCYSACMVKGSNNIGGLIGTTLGDIESCYAAGPVFGLGTTGGFIGNSRAAVKYSYSWGLVTALDHDQDNSFGGFIGLAPATSTITGCYFNTVTSAQAMGVGNRNIPDMPKTTPSSIALNFGGMADWTGTNVSGYYPQLSVFANNAANLNFSYCSALSVVNVNFVSNETAGAVKTSFTAPSKYAIGGVENESRVVIPFGGSATSSVVNGKVISILPTGEVDTLKIKVEAFELPGSSPVVNIKERFRHICFIPDQEEPDCTAKIIAGEPNGNGWSNENVVYEIKSSITGGIGGPATFEQNVTPLNSTGVNNWGPLQGDLHEFDRDTTDIKVQYRALNGAGGAGQPTLPSPVNIDMTKPIIKDVTDVSDPKNPAINQAKVSVTFKDELSKVATAQWQIGSSTKGDIDISQITPDAEGFLTDVITLPRIAGRYSFMFTVTDKAGNEINNDDAGKSLDLHVERDDINEYDYLLDSVTVDGDTAVLVNPNDPYIYKTTVCVVDDTAEVVLTPAPAFGLPPIVVIVTDLEPGENSRSFIIEAKDKNGNVIIIQTFTIIICREIPPASFLSLIVNENKINLKPGIFDYSVPRVAEEVENVSVWYELREEEACKRPSETTFDKTSPFEFDFPLNKGRNVIQLVVTSADKKITNTYNISIIRTKNLVVVDKIDPDEGNLEFEDPDNPEPWEDENGNIVYDLTSKCNFKEHWLTITPVPGNLKVTFDGETREDNKYIFDIANRYTVKVDVTVSPDSTRHYIFNVLKKFNADIFHSRWASTTNDVISVIGNPNNNGGYSFTEYAWLVNGVPRNETRSYIEVMRQSDKVEAILTGVHGIGEGEVAINKIPTCPCVVEDFSAAGVRAYPSILKAGESVTIVTENIPDIDLKEASVSIVSSLGSRVANAPLTGSRTEVKMPDAPGIYLLKVSTKSIIRDFKVILK